MNKTDLIQELINASKNDTLMTPKHDPGNLHITWNNFRTVLSYELSGNLESFIASGNFQVNEYENTNYNNTLYYEIIPNDTTFVPASGVLPNTTQPNSTCDRLIAVSGSIQGWHIYGEVSSNIQQKETSNELINKKLI